MCDNCDDATHRRWWQTTSGVVSLVFLAALVLAASVGVVERLGGSRGQVRAGSCSEAARYSIEFQAAVTRHRASGTDSLRRDTDTFAHEIQNQQLLACAPIATLVRDASQSLRAFCPACAARLDQLRRSGSA